MEVGDEGPAIAKLPPEVEQPALAAARAMASLDTSAIEAMAKVARETETSRKAMSDAVKTANLAGPMLKELGDLRRMASSQRELVRLFDAERDHKARVDRAAIITAEGLGSVVNIQERQTNVMVSMAQALESILEDQRQTSRWTRRWIRAGTIAAIIAAIATVVQLAR